MKVNLTHRLLLNNRYTFLSPPYSQLILTSVKNQLQLIMQR